jgi:hypothetical protein
MIEKVVPTMPPGWTEDEILAGVEESMFGMSDEGVCVLCGETRGNTEPDARNYPCESCGELAVFGFQELLMEGVVEG